MDKKIYLKNRLLKSEIHLNEQQIEQLLMYYEMLTERNKVMNLTAITEFEEVVDKHFVDSLAITQVFGGYEAAESVLSKARLIDLGTGAGFPGIPLKIAFPKLEVIMIDSLNKRIGFINDVIDALGLHDVSAYHGRAEEYGRNEEFREKFDICVSRAVANLSTLSEYCIPFVKVGGMFIPYKSGNVSEELSEAGKAVKVLGGKIKEVKSFTLPETNIERTLVMIEKISQTKKAYPRKAGKPSKEPIQ